MNQENSAKLPLSAADKLFNKNKWIFSLTGVARDLAYQLVATFLLTYIQFGVSLTAVQFSTLYIIIAIGGKIWDAINDPFMGAIIEGSHMKFGKFKPWILLGGLSCGVVIALMFAIHPVGWGFVAYMAVIYLLWETTFTMNDIGYWAMLPSLSSKTEQRNNVTMLTVLFAGIGAIIGQGVIPILTTGNMIRGYTIVGIGIAVIYMIANTLCAVFIKETPRDSVSSSEKISVKKMWATIKKNDQILWMTLSMLFYNIGSALLVALAANLVYIEIGYNGQYYFYIVVAYGVTTVLANILYPKIVAKLGRRKLQALAIILACIGYTIIALMGWSAFFPFDIWMVCGFMILIASGQSLFYMSTIVNMTNCVEYNEYKHGERNEAVISTLRPFMAKFADALKYGITIAALLVSGIYVMSQSISALETQKSMFEGFTTAEQYEYIATVQDYYNQISIYNGQLEELYATINNEIENDTEMSKWQLKAEDILALGEVEVIKGEDKWLVKAMPVPNPLQGEQIDNTTSFTMELTGAADKAFRDKADIGSRIILRVTLTVVPMILLVIGLLIQRKKFIIDEEYYDTMIAEINSRKPQTEQPASE